MQKLVKDILKAASQPDHWEATLDSFCHSFDIKGCGMFSVHEFKSQSMDFVWSKIMREGLSADTLRQLESGGEESDSVGYQFLIRMPAQKFYTEAQCFGVDLAKQLPPSKLRADTEALGIENRIGSVLNRTGPWFDGFFAHAKDGAQTTRLIDNEYTDIMLPIVANSVSLGRTLTALRTQYNAALSVLDNLGVGVFLVDISGCVVESNAEAKRALSLDDGLAVTRDKRIKLATTQKTTELYQMIDAVNDLLSGDVKKVPSLLSSPKRSDGYDFLFSVMPIDDQAGELENGFKSAFVAVIDPNREEALSTDGLRTLGGLTKAETSIVDLLVQGFRLDDVAAQRDVSMSTVKTQLRNLSGKLRCTTQSDLIRMAAATRIPVKMPDK